MRVHLLCLLGLAACAGPGPAAPLPPRGPVGPGAPAGGASAPLEAAWRAAGLSPQAPVDDATYLRRAYLDLTGRIPDVGAVVAFERDARPDKRARLVEELLDDPAHARRLARVWERTLMGPETKQRLADRGAMRRWLEARFAEDAPWDVIVRDVVAAEGTNSVGGRRLEALTAEDDARGEAEREAGVDGATNFTLRFGRRPADLAGATAKAFLGVQIQCAQCHDHKTEPWKQGDFRAFAATFVHLRARPIERAQGEIPIVEIEGVARANRRLAGEDDPLLAETEPRALDGASLAGEDPRAALARWITARDNPWFARAMVNRAWAELVGAGFVEPVDDLRPSNPPVLPEVFDALTEDFVAHGYDLDRLYATIAASPAYDRAVAAGATPHAVRQGLFSLQSLRPLDADQLLDSVFVATEIDALLRERAPDQASLVEAVVRRRMGFVFESDDEAQGAPTEATLQQALFLQNGPLVTASASLRRGGALARLLEQRDEDVVTTLYLRTLGRRPRAAELTRAVAYLRQDDAAEDAPDPGSPARPGRRRDGDPRPLVRAALRSDAREGRERNAEDLSWTLLNASEFALRP